MPGINYRAGHGLYLSGGNLTSTYAKAVILK